MGAGHVFISHSSNDRDEATELSEFIEGRGVRTWIAPRDVRPGQDYSEQLQHAIETCAAFVVLITEKANSSPYVRAETEMAFSTNKPIFPIRRSDIQPAAGLAFFLKIRHWTDAFGKHADAAMERLGQELEALLGAPKAEAEAVTTPPVSPPPPPPPPSSQPPPPPPPAETSKPPLAAPPLPAEQAERMAAAVGPNSAWYLAKWQKMEADRSALSWNWPAFLANLFWFAYRKMWLPLAVAIILFLLTDFTVSRDPGLRGVGWLFLFALALLSGAIGNALYRRQVNKLVARADGLDQPVALAQIGAQGGISVPGLLTMLGIFLLLFVVSAFAQMNQARLNPTPPVQPNPQAGQQSVPNAPAEPPAAAAPPTVDASYVIGRWTSDGVCNSGFNSDGSFNSGNGGTGYWSLAGDQLTLTGTSTMTLRVVPIDANNMSLVQPDGTTIRVTRC